MGLEFKHLIYVVALGSVIWAFTVCALVSFEDVSGSLELKSELTHSHPSDFLRNLNELNNVRQVLNVFLPLGLMCILYLGYTYTINPIGLGSMVIVIAAFLFAADSVLDAKDSVEQEYEVEISESVWWISAD